MATLSWIAALTLLAAPQNPSPAQDSVTPEKRAEDNPAHASPYSAFGAPNARRAPSGKRATKRLHCKDGFIATRGTCKDHGGVKR